MQKRFFLGTIGAARTGGQVIQQAQLRFQLHVPGGCLQLGVLLKDELLLHICHLWNVKILFRKGSTGGAGGIGTVKIYNPVDSRKAGLLAQQTEHKEAVLIDPDSLLKPGVSNYLTGIQLCPDGIGQRMVFQ